MKRAIGDREPLLDSGEPGLMTYEDVMDLSENDDHNEGNCFINSSSEMSISL